jgi:hypothetical protein
MRLCVFARKTDNGFYSLLDINLMPFDNLLQQISHCGKFSD